MSCFLCMMWPHSSPSFNASVSVSEKHLITLRSGYRLRLFFMSRPSSPIDEGVTPDSLILQRRINGAVKSEWLKRLKARRKLRAVSTKPFKIDPGPGGPGDLTAPLSIQVFHPPLLLLGRLIRSAPWSCLPTGDVGYSVEFPARRFQTGSILVRQNECLYPSKSHL